MSLCLQLLTSAGIGGLVAGGVAYALLTFYLPGYLKKKGENLATREDIEGITEKVKGIESKFDHLLEDRKATNRMREVAIKRRLQTHQEAFAYWGRLCASAHSRTPDAVVETGLAARKWWQENCLYLEPSARKAFSIALIVAPQYQQLLRSPPPRYDAVLLASMWSQLTGVGDTILDAAKLPGLTTEEKVELKGNDSQP